MMKSLLIAAVKTYQALFIGARPRCRFWPSCSEYSLQAVQTHGAAAGASLTLRRILRCHPLGGHGFDPVPDSLSKGLSHS